MGEAVRNTAGNAGLAVEGRKLPTRSQDPSQETSSKQVDCP